MVFPSVSGLKDDIVFCDNVLSPCCDNMRAVDVLENRPGMAWHTGDILFAQLVSGGLTFFLMRIQPQSTNLPNQIS